MTSSSSESATRIARPALVGGAARDRATERLAASPGSAETGPVERGLGKNRPSDRGPLPGTGVGWGAYLGFWVVVAGLFALPLPLAALAEGASIPWNYTVTEAVRWLLWGAFTPLAWWLARRVPIAREGLARRLGWNLLGGLAITFAYALTDLVASDLVAAAVSYAQVGRVIGGLFSDWPRLFYWGLEYRLHTYIGIAAVLHAFLGYREAQRRQIEQSQLEARLARARLDALKMQLRPHFLFNTLNAVSSLMHADVDTADRVIARLSDLLRLSLDEDDRQLVPLRQELDLLDRYLQIEQVRFGDRLRVVIDVPPECMQARVPQLLLQPLAENAVQHGVEARREGGVVRVVGRRDGETLVLTVADDGPGLDGVESSAGLEATGRAGVGLANTRERLRQLYGDEHTLRLERADLGGLQVAIELPFESTDRPLGASDLPHRST